MSQNIFLKRSNPLILLILALMSCAIPTQKGADIVAIVYELPVKDSCRFLGQATASDGGIVSGEFMKDERILKNTANILKNKAYAMGGDVVYIQQEFNKNKNITRVKTNQTMQGYVYHCQGYDAE
ncbi:MAG: DUF4156 domain-containing protein [Methyloprofundus sp.]|nr:DUF4156 domain-containing protein [Methyloprofundus sp.]